MSLLIQSLWGFFLQLFEFFSVGKWAYTCFTLEKAREVVGRPEI